MVQPIQYQVPGVPDPFTNVVQGLRIGSSLAEMDAMRSQRALQEQALQQQLQQRQMEMQRQQQLSTAYTSLLDKVRSDTWKPEDFQQVAFLAPKEMAETTLKSWERLSKNRQAQTLSDTTKAMAALGSKSPEMGVQFLMQRAAAYRNQGNEDQAKWLETQAKLAEVDPVQVRAMLGSELYGLPGGKDAIEALAKAEENRRAAELQPLKLSEQTATTLIKQAEAKFAPQKFGLEIDLTQSQIAQAQAARRAQDAAAAKSGAEAKRAQAQADQMSAGIIPADKRPEAESKFRKEYSDQTKGYQEVKSAYGRVLASDDSAVGDLSLIFGYMKMLDPGSVVREGEFATAQNAAGVPERIVNIYNKIISGERLNDSQRKAFKGQAERLFKQAGQQESEVRRGLERIAKGYGLNTANIFLEPVESVPTAPREQVTGSKPVTQSFTSPPQAPAAPPAAGETPRTREQLKQDYQSQILGPYGPYGRGAQQRNIRVEY